MAITRMLQVPSCCKADAHTAVLIAALARMVQDSSRQPLGMMLEETPDARRGHIQ